jgi:hypothetical protein
MNADYTKILLTGEDRPDAWSVHRILDLAPMVKPAIVADFYNGEPINRPVGDGFEACNTNIKPIGELDIEPFEFDYGVRDVYFNGRFNDNRDIENNTLASFEITDSQGVVHWINYKMFGATPSATYVEGNKILYTNVMPDVDLEYVVGTVRLKENIIIKNAKEEYKYPFTVKLDDVTYPELQEEGAIFFKALGTGEVVYRIEKPYAIDGAGKQTFGVKYYLGKITYNDIEYDSIEVVIEDTEFLDTATFPITIDPTTIYNVSAGNYDGYVFSANSPTYPPTFGGGYNVTGTVMGTDKQYISTNYRVDNSFVKFDTSSVPDTATVIGTILNMHVGTIYNIDSRNLILEYYMYTNMGDAQWLATTGNNANAGIPLSSILSNAWNQYTLINLSNINKTGETGFRFGISGGQPTGDNYIAHHTFESATKPYLSVTYSIPPTTPTLLTPNGGETYNASANITWQSSTDPDADALTYDIDYSANGGSAWVDIASGVSGTSYVWNTSALPAGSTYLVRIRAYDGVAYSAFDQSNGVFTIRHNFGKKIMGVVAPAKVMGSVAMKVLGNS